jgi:hypothetical protein
LKWDVCFTPMLPLLTALQPFDNLVANHFLETDLEKLRASLSTGYTRGKLGPTTESAGISKL